MGKKKIVLDTNILISALGWNGNPREIFRSVLEEKFELVISHRQLGELKKVMAYPKFNFSHEQKERFLAVLLEVATVIETFGTVRVIVEDPDDNVILETGLLSNADFIISGDEHLLKLKTYGNIKIVTATAFLELNGQ